MRTVYGWRTDVPVQMIVVDGFPTEPIWNMQGWTVWTSWKMHLLKQISGL